jgi:hypothetical protein
MIKISILVLILGLAGCHELFDDLDEGIDDSRCDEVIDETPTVAIDTASPVGFTTGAMTLKLRGTASHTLGLSIRRITVAGLDATSDSFNFAAWSIEVSEDLLTAQIAPMSTLPQDVTLDIVGYDACSDNATAPTTVMIQVDDP